MVSLFCAYIRAAHVPSILYIDLEKRQDLFRRSELKPLPPRVVMVEGESIELAPRASSAFNLGEKERLSSSGDNVFVAGAWK